MLTHAYRKGFDVIEIKGIDKEGLSELRQLIEKTMLGFEIVKSFKNEAVMENISEPHHQKFETIMSKIFDNIKETFEIIVDEAKNNKFANFQEIESIKNQQDRFILFCRRIISRQKIESAETNWELLTFLTHIQHSIYYLYEYLNKNKIKISKETKEKLNQLNDYFNLYYKAYSEKNLQYINTINNQKNKYQFGECLKLIEKSKGKETVVASYIREIFRLIQIGTSPILTEILEKKD